MKRLPSKKVTLVPVSCTSNFSLSKSWSALTVMLSSNPRKAVAADICHTNTDAGLLFGAVHKCAYQLS